MATPNKFQAHRASSLWAVCESGNPPHRDFDGIGSPDSSPRKSGRRASQAFIQPRLISGVACLVALLSGCGGGGDSVTTALPETVAITADEQAEAGVATAFSASPMPSQLHLSWDFGDGSTSSETSPRHVFKNPGEYQVSLTVRNEAGETKSGSIKVSTGYFERLNGKICSGPNRSGWCWQRPLPAGNQVADVTFVDGDTGWAVGDAGLIMKTTDAGVTWTPQKSGVNASLGRVRFLDKKVGWAVGQTAYLHTTDGGETWHPQVSGISQQWASAPPDLWLIDPNRAIVGLGWWASQHTRDGGQTWSSSSMHPTLVTSNGTVWSVSSWEGVMKSTDMGETTSVSFKPTDANQSISLSLLDFADDMHGWVLGSVAGWTPVPSTQTAMWRTIDGGANWVPLPANGLPANVSYFKFYNALEGWVVGDGTIYRSTDGGASWLAVATPASVFVAHAAAIDARTLWFATYNGDIYLTRDAGVAWKLFKVQGEGESGWPDLKVGTRGELYLHFADRWYRSVDDGQNWTRMFGADPTEADASFVALWFFDARNGLALDSKGHLVETADAGVTWSVRDAMSFAYTYNFLPSGRIQFASRNVGWLVADGLGGSNVYKTTDSGKSWWAPPQRQSIPSPADLHFIDEQRGWLVSMTGSIYHSEDGGQTWSEQARLPYRWTTVRFANSQVGVALGNDGIIARTTDGGATWTLKYSGTPQELRRMVFSNESTGWAVGTSGAVLKTTDAGETWSTVAVPAFKSLNDIFFTDPNTGWAVGDGGVLIETKDGGLSWSAQATGTSQDLTRLFMVDSRTGWVAGAHGAILTTATGGR
ncbi:MAG TPA: YCF48-related protein [Burkholderiaceae bacterium]|nr:YCF48-related protein [Burkholderiaceae bacterium]